MNEFENSLQVADDDSLSIKDIINTISELMAFIKKKLLILFLFGIFGGAIGFYIANRSVPLYSARVKFIMKESGGASSLMNSLGSLGSLIGGGTSTASPMGRTLAILGSERIIGTILFKEVTINNKKDLLVNHIIDVFELRKAWEKDSSLNGVSFSTNSLNTNILNKKQKKAYKKIVGMFIGEGATLLNKSFDKSSGVFDVTVNAPNEELSIETSKILYKELELFIYNQSINSSGKNINILNEKVDSIKAALSSVQNALARNTDRTLGLLMQEDRVDQKQLILKEQMLTIMYGEAQKNLETFRFVNESINTGFEILECPISPIAPNQKSKIKFSILGFILLSFTSLGFLYIKKWVKDQL